MYERENSTRYALVGYLDLHGITNRKFRQHPMYFNITSENYLFIYIVIVSATSGLQGL